MHEGQKRAWDSTARFVCVFKGWQAGGTLIGPPWLFREMQDQGPGDYAVITPNYPLMDNKARPELLKQFAGLVRTSGNELIVTPDGAMALWGDREAKGRILLRHAERAEAIEAFTAKAIWVDEPGQLDDEIWEAIQARGAVNRARYLLTSRPYRINFFTRLWNQIMYEKDGKWIRKVGADPDIDCINFSSLANPEFPPEEYDRQKLRLPEWRFVMKYDGIPTKPAGAIYDMWQTVPRTNPDNRWQRASGHDFGPLNMAGIWAYKHPTETTDDDKPVWVIYSTYHDGAKKTPQEHVEHFKRRCAKKEDEVLIPWAWGGAHSNEDGWRHTFTLLGYPILEPPNVGVAVGIETLYAMLKTGEIRITEDLEKLIEELENYSYEVDDEGEPNQDKIENKAKYHRADACRYLAVGLSGGVGDIVVLKPKSEDKTDGRIRTDEYGIDLEEGTLPVHGPSGGQSSGLQRRSVPRNFRRVAR